MNYTEEETGLEDGYPDHPAADRHPFYHTIPGMREYESRYERIRLYQEGFVDRLLESSLAHGNVLYCMNNETSTDVLWGQYWMAFIKDRARAAGTDVCVTDMFDDAWKPEESPALRVALENPSRYDFLDISQVNSRNFGEAHWKRLEWIVSQLGDDRRPLNHTKIYSDGETAFGSGTPQDGIERFWRNLLCGCASSRFHRPASGIGLNRTSQACLRAARQVESLVRFWEVKPRMDLLAERRDNSAYLAADPGRAYVLFFCRGGRVRLNMAESPKAMTQSWVDINSGEWGERSSATGGDIMTVAAPTESPWVAVFSEPGADTAR
jgi:hypothetical protein